MMSQQDRRRLVSRHVSLPHWGGTKPFWLLPSQQSTPTDPFGVEERPRRGSSQWTARSEILHSPGQHHQQRIKGKSWDTAHPTSLSPSQSATALPYTAANSTPQVKLKAVSPTQWHLAQGLTPAQCWVWGALMRTEAHGPFNHTITDSDPCWEGRSNPIFRLCPISLLAPSALNSTVLASVTLTAHLEISKGIGLTKCPRKHNLFHSLKHPKPQHAGSSLNREQPSCFPTPVPTHRPHPSSWCGSAQSMPLAMPQGPALTGEMTAPCCCSQANAWRQAQRSIPQKVPLIAKGAISARGSSVWARAPSPLGLCNLALHGWLQLTAEQCPSLPWPVIKQANLMPENPSNAANLQKTDKLERLLLLIFFSTTKHRGGTSDAWEVLAPPVPSMQELNPEG